MMQARCNNCCCERWLCRLRKLESRLNTEHCSNDVRNVRRFLSTMMLLWVCRSLAKKDERGGRVPDEMTLLVSRAKQASFTECAGRCRGIQEGGASRREEEARQGVSARSSTDWASTALGCYSRCPATVTLKLSQRHRDHRSH